MRAAFKLPSWFWRASRLTRWQLRDFQLVWLNFAIVLFLGIFVLYPLFSVFKTSLIYKGTFNAEYFLELFYGKHYLIRPLLNSLLLASTTGLLCTTFGLILSFAIAKANIPGAKLFRYILMLPLISPPFLMALALILLLGRNGILTRWLTTTFGIRFNIYGFPGLVITQFFTFLPLAFLTAEAVVEMLARSQVEEASVDLGASRWKTFTRISMPLISPGVLSAFLITFIRSLEDFGNPIVIQGRFPVLTTQVYLAITGMYNVPLAATLASILLIFSFSLFMLYKMSLKGKSYVLLTGRQSQPTKNQKIYVSGLARFLLFIITLLISLAILTLYGIIFVGAFTKLWGIDYTLTLSNFDYVFGVARGYLINSLKLAGISTIVGGVLGTIIAYLVARKKIALAGFVDFIALLNFAVPGIVLGLGFVLAFNTPPLKLTGSALIIVMVFVTQRMPVVIREVDSVLRQVDVSLDEASADLGSSTFKTLLKIIVPIILPGIIGSMAYMFAACITSISAVIMVVSPKWYLITLSMLSQIDLGALSVACAFGVVIIVLVFGIIVVFDIFGKRAIQYLLNK